MALVATPTRTVFREALQEYLAAGVSAPGRPVRFVGGRLEGPQEDGDIGCVWWEGKKNFSRGMSIEEDYYRIRYFKLYRQNQGQTPRMNVQPLEEATEEIEALLVGRLTAFGQDFFFRVEEISVNYDTQVVEIQITQFAGNRTSAGG